MNWVNSLLCHDESTINVIVVLSLVLLLFIYLAAIDKIILC